MSGLAETQSRLMAYLMDTTVQAQSAGHAVYHNAYRARLTDALTQAYPRLRLWLGDEAFVMACSRYIERHPSRTWTLGVFGAGLDTVLGDLYPTEAEVRELAWLEWALHAAFSGPAGPDFDPATLLTADWERAGIAFVPTLALRPITSNAAAIWQALSRNEPPPGAQVLPTPAALAVWRHGLEPKFRTVDLDEYDGLQALLAGASFAQLCASLSPADGRDPSAVAGAWLAEWIADGRLEAVR